MLEIFALIQASVSSEENKNSETMAMERGSRELLILISHLVSSIVKRLHLLLMFSTEFEEFSLYLTFSNDSINTSLIEFTLKSWK